MIDVSLAPATPVHGRPSEPEQLRALAREFEAGFLAQMLESAGLGPGESSFGGGIGEEQMQGFLIREKARVIADAGGIGLAETVFRYLVAASDSKGAE